jgi:hypothetical protein
MHGIKIIKEVIDEYMSKVPEIREYCQRCLNVQRYDGNVVLMVVDASFVSLGLNYFTVVIPKVLDFKSKLMETGKIVRLEDLALFSDKELYSIWKNKRSWYVARKIAEYLSSVDRDDRKALARWAGESRLDGWQKDPIGSIKGVGINTFQYLRMMGGVDTVMPDKVVKKVFSEVAEKSGLNMPEKDLDFIKWVENLAELTGYRAIELCWMTWFVQYEGNEMRARKYLELMRQI